MPRRNGELVFESPWESRAFGLAVALVDSSLCQWEEFRLRLINEIAAQPGRNYYESWLAALERLVLERGTLGAEEISGRITALAQADHDHNI